MRAKKKKINQGKLGSAGWVGALVSDGDEVGKGEEDVKG